MKISRIIRLAGIIAAVAFLASCSVVEITTGTWYHLSSDEDSGYAIFNKQGDKDLSCVYYRDGGTLTAQRTTAVAKERRKTVCLTFPDGTRRDYTVERHNVPAYIPVKEYHPYIERKYSFRMEPDVFYAKAKGYWTYYDEPWEEDFFVSYAKKAFNLNIWDLSLRSNILSQIFQPKLTEQKLTMDIFVPVDDKTDKRPLLVLLHGGAFFAGNKTDPDIRLWAERFAERGYVTAAVNYRLGFDLTVQGEVNRAGYRAVQDARAAIRFLLNRKDLKIDHDLIFIAGPSAGGIASLNTAFVRDKDRPVDTFSGPLGGEGALDSVNPDMKADFTIRGVGNLWGAVQSLSILDNSPNTAIISWHNQYDPTVPYGEGSPFKGYLDFASKWFFDTMWGSAEIDARARQKGMKTKFTSYHIPDVHSLDREQAHGELNGIFEDIDKGMSEFFEEAMILHPVKVRKGLRQSFSIDMTDVSSCSWKVEGGLLLSVRGGVARVIFFADAPEHSVTVTGRYRSGRTFTDTYTKE